MDPDWDEVSRLAVPPSGPHVLPTVASTIAFDDTQELLWTGNEFGRVASFYGPELQRYTSVRAHPASEGPVRQLLFHHKGVISVSSKSVHFISRRGITIWHITHEEMEDLRCMSFTQQSSKIIVAGCQPIMFHIDVDKGTIVDKITTEFRYTIMKKSRYLCAATDTGSVNALSLSDFSVVKSWKAHGTVVNDMDARNDYLVTCGFSVRHLGSPIVDPLANVYDLKTLTPLPPIPFHAGAAYVRMHPKLQTTSFVASQTGQLQVVDLMNPNAINLRQANVTFMLGLEISPSGEALAVNDAECLVHLWGSLSKIHFNEMSKESEFADAPSRPPLVDWLNDTPLNVIGMPYYHERLLSAWPSHMVFEIGSIPPQVDQAITPYLHAGEIGHYAPNPRKTRRYQVENTRAQPIPEPALAAPKFLSERARAQAKAKFNSNLDEAAKNLAEATITQGAEEDPLLKYSNVEIKYSKFGVDDFDFRYYNKTLFSGLETHIANSFTNSLLQLYKFIPLIRNLALHHAATNCIYDNCLLCEMGFLFDMLDKANGQNCQATNLLKTFSGFREAANLGLLEENLTAKSLSLSIQSVNRFFLNQISHDFRLMFPHSDQLDHTLSTDAVESIRCMLCHNETIRPSNAFVNELIYPTIDLKQSRRSSSYQFSSILKSTIERETQNRGWCSHCRRYQQVSIRKTVHKMPLVLMINAAINNANIRQLWGTPGWLPEEVGILLEDGRIQCFEGEELKTRQKNDIPSFMVYELVGLVAEIDIPDHHKPHLVSFINVAISSRDTSEMDRWHLFNDFLVTEVSRDEVFAFSQTWKTPCSLAYQVQTARHGVDDSWKDELDTTLLFYEWSMNNYRLTEACQILQADEKPSARTPVALDTEFVDLEKAEIEVKADGTQEMVRPSKSGLARVSVIRGSGAAEGVPFIDDYITIKDPIVDYVTQYSGIKPGDLDPRTSSHNLVPLKVAYKKLWLLLNLGCVFVGHGLASDFRKINIQVPKSQTVDTQYLFFHPLKNRRLSLRYLAWAVFKEYIQEESTISTTYVTSSDPSQAAPISALTSASASEGHDSIEDARMALRLWKKFQEYEDAGIVSQMLEEIFREGFKLGFKPPPRNSSNSLALSGTANSHLPVSGRNTPDLGIVAGTLSSGGSMNGSAPSTPGQAFRRSAALTPSNGSFAGGASKVPDIFGGSPLR
ncbi:PAB-dependent poly(A)-specific ribonuclease subunit PAN2 [Paracoccidioides brasiliensis Pb18]|uniref:PAN2-PAN3 deadenylation complex catalytic subunit PAN2 n=1 Tax=Paracoccidioides brasiliensis (strain Pb18) TaxID=502780 RepID=C1GN14_PARBD|nr:PAB-dependent poly(A)-specific ribonuclease subunit PAN2 [Paracoccidioides brasiliensis Pb18]EEH45016.1 PAB-dependent poly(A)-specific ribonuclease subunit PAN2 [Paracoccidioides brasiliensis Pb18]